MVAIGCTLRSGSNLLCAMLHANGFGAPAEWFQDQDHGGAAGRTVESLADAAASQVERFQAAHAGSTWRAVKFDWQQFQRVRRPNPNAPALATLLASLGDARWMFLRRRDLAAQAASLHAAQVTGGWMGEARASNAGLRYDFDRLRELFADLAAEEYCWTEYFRDAGIEPMRLYYEDIVAWSPEAWLALFRGLAPDYDAARLDLSPLGLPVPASPELEQMKRHFRADMLAGRQTRSLSTLAEEMSAYASRVERQATPDGVLSRFAQDMLSSPAGFTLRKLDIRADLTREGEVALVERDHFLDQAALRLDAHASCGFAACGCRLMIQFLSHGWSGHCEVRFGDEAEDIDLYAERACTHHYIRDLPAGFSAPVSVRSTGRRHPLSEGWEVWVQRVYLLDGPAAARPPDA